MNNINIQALPTRKDIPGMLGHNSMQVLYTGTDKTNRPIAVLKYG